jgi:hypothetical protein
MTISTINLKRLAVLATIAFGLLAQAAQAGVDRGLGVPPSEPVSRHAISNSVERRDAVVPDVFERAVARRVDAGVLRLATKSDLHQPRPVETVASDGFDWTSATIGGTTVFGIVLASALAAAALRRRRPLAGS